MKSKSLLAVTLFASFAVLTAAVVFGLKMANRRRLNDEWNYEREEEGFYDDKN